VGLLKHIASKEGKIMAKIPLTDAMVDSHKFTLAIHLSAAERCIKEDQWNAAKLALQMALPHANAIGNRDIKRKVFTALNIARAKAKEKVLQ
jgi:hypothetical protein